MVGCSKEVLNVNLFESSLIRFTEISIYFSSGPKPHDCLESPGLIGLVAKDFEGGL